MQTEERIEYNDRHYLADTPEHLHVGDDLILRAFPKEMAVKGKRILDLGCGPCLEMLSLIPGNDVVGIDLSPTSLADANRIGVAPILADLERPLPFADQSFDIVVAKDILEHLVNPEALLWEMRRVLRNDGVAVINVPNPFVYSMRLQILRGGPLIPREHKCQPWDYFHLRFFTYRSFHQLLSWCGFEKANECLDIFPATPKGLPGPVDRWLARRIPSLFAHAFFTLARKRNA